MSNSDKKGLRRPPYAFTEHGITMLSSVLKNERAIQMNTIFIMDKLRALTTVEKKQKRKIGFDAKE